ncbi:SCO family protein [Roseivirga sp. BDSF3-8]|uniref:SCO family protein n=1 Tax=Roseivirga sp. BDSF3-8 TaxID=3241598 RepID=UPI0035320A71
MSTAKKIILLIILLALPGSVFIFLHSFGENEFGNVPVLYENGVESSLNDCSFEPGVQHTIPPFSLVNEKGEPVTEEELEGTLTIVDFIFTTCPSICPKMSDAMVRVQESLKNDANVQIISISVNPEYDTPEVLQSYADRFGAIDGKWQFLTGDQNDIYNLARCGFLLPVEDGGEVVEDFVHSPMFVLVDSQRRIRGYYNGLDPEKLETLVTEAKVLLTKF